MPVRSGFEPATSVAHADAATISASLGEYQFDYWPPHATALLAYGSAAAGHSAMQEGSACARAGSAVRAFFDDYYFRIHVTPARIDLGNLVSAQQREVRVWNAWPSRPVTLTDVVVDADSAIAVSGQGAPPLTLNPLQELTWQLSVGVIGASVIDTDVQWLFAGDPPLAVHITGNRVTAWTWAPNWAKGVTERLEWLTLLERGFNGNETATPLRETPRRSWEFSPIAEGTDRQRLEAMLYDASSRTWAVPVWPDSSALAVDIAAGAASIPVATTGLDYHVGGLVMLLGRDAAHFETVEIDTVSANAITLARPTLGAWPAGTPIYPARTARLDTWPTLNRYTTRLVDAGVRFIGTDASDYPAALPATLYRGVPVLETRVEWSDNPTTSYGRDVTLIESATGVVQVDDDTGLPWPVQSHRWQVYGRAERSDLRSLLYGLAGKANRIWLPTWQDDLYPMAPAAGALIDVAHCGYTAYLHGQPGRRDIRVELADGSVLYRRITASTELSGTVERLQVDSAWPATLAVADIQSISYLGLCRLASDAAEISHLTDSEGAAVCALGFAQATGNG